MRIARILLENGANVNFRDKDGITLLAAVQPPTEWPWFPKDLKEPFKEPFKEHSPSFEDVFKEFGGVM